MVFLIEADFKKTIQEDQLTTIIGGDASLLDSAELAAMSEVESYLRQRFDVAAIWGKSGNERDPFLVMFLVDIMLYHLHSTVNSRKIAELRIQRYDSAIAWLNRVSKGQITPDLPVSEPTADTVRWGSNAKLGNSY